MGVYDAMNNAVGGLQAQAYALQNISGNIANSGTVGYKAVGTAFQDLLSSTGTESASQTSGSTTARSVTTTTAQGNVSSSPVATNMAISGNGYFQVLAKTGSADGASVLGANSYYTRQGDFTMSSEGYLVNSAGYYLTGIPIDATTGNTTGSSAVPVQISTGLIQAKASSSITYRGNLPSATTVPTLLPADLTASPASLATVAASDNSAFLSKSLAGGSVTAYDTQGNEVSVQLRWARTSTNNWNLYYQSNSAATGAATQWTSAGTPFTFNSTGKLISPTTDKITIPSMNVDTATLGDIKFSYGTNLTQYNSGTTVTQTDVTQDGYASGSFTKAAVGSDGVVTASYSNGKTIDLYKVGVYSFNGDSELLAVSGNAYSPTKGSGSPLLNDSAVVKGSSLEASNVDITDQFSKMIVTQQAYSANSKVISTANTMMQSVLDIIR